MKIRAEITSITRSGDMLRIEGYGRESTASRDGRRRPLMFEVRDIDTNRKSFRVGRLVTLDVGFGA